MDLKEIYKPIQKDLAEVERFLKLTLKNTGYQSISNIGRYVSEGSGKRIRPALVILSAKATLKSQTPILNSQLIKIACAIELIHIASLIHDDVIDQASLRHHKPTVNLKYGQDVSITLGDYLYAKAFELISGCNNLDILSCISCATRLMCEGQLIQVCGRKRPDLMKSRYIIIVKKKTAALFSASCQTGAILANAGNLQKNLLRDFGLNFGIAFQIIDDCLDLLSTKKELGKDAGLDFKMGEITLPVLNLLSYSKERDRLLYLIEQQDNFEAFKELRQRFFNSRARLQTKNDILFYIQSAKKNLDLLGGSSFKNSLFSLADYISGRISL
jgi:octaprenyl-diphosphate synthase